MADVVKVLSIDGGGIRGIIPATVLAEIERRTGSRIAQLFDLVAGTSTGGILALGLVKPAGGDGGGPDYPASKFVERATSAAPTYFEPEELKTTTPHGGLIDGGVFANNPAMCAYVEAKKLHPDADEVLVASFGTGQHTRPIHYGEAKDWGLAHWAKPILDVVFDGVSDTVDHQLKILCQVNEGEDPRYLRFRTELDVGSDELDNASKSNITLLKHKAEDLIEQQSESLDQLCRALAPAPTPAHANA